jgi:hypothetical protein
MATASTVLPLGLTDNENRFGLQVMATITRFFLLVSFSLAVVGFVAFFPI